MRAHSRRAFRVGSDHFDFFGTAILDIQGQEIWPGPAQETIITSKTLPATLDSLSALREYARQSATAAGIGDEQTYKLLLAVDEMATNVVLHGYKAPRPTESITIRSDVSNGELTVTLEDSAPAFDPRTRVMPQAEDLSRPLDERVIGGLGIYLAISSVDRFDYRYENGRNINLFALKVPTR